MKLKIHGIYLGNLIHILCKFTKITNFIRSLKLQKYEIQSISVQIYQIWFKMYKALFEYTRVWALLIANGGNDKYGCGVVMGCHSN